MIVVGVFFIPRLYIYQFQEVLMRLIIVLVFFVHSLSSGQEIYPNEEGGDLLELLVSDFRPASNLLSYSATRDLMYREVYRDSEGYVSCYYTGHAIFLPEKVDPSAFLYDNENPNGITAEHIYPQSKGASEGNARVDMHSLVPCIWRANQARSNYPFDEIDDEDTDHWYAQTEDLEEIPTTNIDDYSERLNGGFGNLGKFEPRETVKGDVARAVFYFYTMYREEADAADINYFDSMKDVLLQWHYADPVDNLEQSLNHKKSSYQENKINPFIADCTLVERAYFPNRIPLETCLDNFSSVSETGQSYKQSIYPNPVSEVLYLDSFDSQANTRIVIQNLSGKVLLSLDKPLDGVINCSDLSTGMYILSAYTARSSTQFRFLKL